MDKPFLLAVGLALASVRPALAAPDCKFDKTTRCEGGGEVYASAGRFNTSGVGRSSHDMAAQAKGLKTGGVPALANKGGSPAKASSAPAGGGEGGSGGGFFNSKNMLAFGAGMGMGAVIGIIAGVVTGNPLIGLAAGAATGLVIGAMLWFMNKD